MYEFVEYNGYYDDEDGTHRCPKGHKTVYQLFSGGNEFYCEECDYNGIYPPGEPRIRAHLLRTPEGIEQFRKEMNEELERRRMMLDG